MGDIKAIDIQNRAFSVRINELHRPFSETYEMRIVAQSIWKGPILKMGLKSGEEWKAMATTWPGSVPKMLKEMDEVGVELVLMDQLKLWSYHEHRMGVEVSLDEMDKIVAEGKGRIIPGGGYNPFQIKESLEELVIGVKEHGFKYVWYNPATYGVAFDDRRNYPLYGKCQELEIPVAIQAGHAAEPVPCKGSRPIYIDIVAIDFPGLTIILTHTGYPWVHEWISMCWKHPNVYGCINGYYPKDLDPAIIQFMDTRGRDKVMWGTNSWGLKRCKQEFMELPIRGECKKKILRDNAIRVFKLPLTL
jgi:predicted TIM-barrel fold metal-dependent hydrolase